MKIGDSTSLLGPGARAPNPGVVDFLETVFRARSYGDGEDRDCAFHSALSLLGLVLGERSAAYEVGRLN